MAVIFVVIILWMTTIDRLAGSAKSQRCNSAASALQKVTPSRDGVEFLRMLRPWEIQLVRESMEQTWRWFGPEDRVTLRDAREAGADGIVTALHELPPGTIWPVGQILQRQAEVQSAGLKWSVVESLDVSERIKTRAPGWQEDITAFQQSIRNLAACGLRTIAYNLMPL